MTFCSMMELVFARQLKWALDDGAAYAEVWMCKNCPSFVAGFNDEDEMMACYLLPRVEA